MGHPQGQLASFPHPLEGAGLLLPGQRERDLRLGVLGPAAGVLVQRLMEDAVAVNGVVEVGDRLAEGLRRELGEKLLEGAEGHGTLIEVLRRLRRLEADAVLHEIVDAVAAGPVLVIALSVQSRHQLHGASGVAGVLRRELRHGLDVLHQGGHVKGVADALENIAAAGGGDQQIRLIDVAAAIALQGEGRTLQREVIGGGGLHPQLLGIDLLVLHGLDGVLHGQQVLGIGHAIPHILRGQNADGAQALLDLGIGHGGQEVLAFQGVLRQVFLQKGGESVHELLQQLLLEAPEVHGYHGVAGQVHIVRSVLGIGGVAAPLFNVGALGHGFQKAVLHRAHAAGNVAVFRDRIAHQVAHHGVLVGPALLLEEVVDGLDGGGAVIVVRVQNSKGTVDGILRASDGMGGAPGLCPALRHGKALGELVYLLEHIPHIEEFLHAAAHGLFEIRFNFMLDDEYHLAEAGLPRVIQGIVNDNMTLIVDWGDLLQSAETGTHSGSHNDQYRFSHCILLLCSIKFCSSSVIAGRRIAIQPFVVADTDFCFCIRRTHHNHFTSERWAYYPFTPPEARPLTRFFSMHIKRMTTGMMANREAANRYCHSIIL